jgi:uncharacterized protein YhaN
MRLLSCHIDNFGKLSNQTFEFDEGLNRFHQPNAWGKSTLAAFLRVMFYGFESKKAAGTFDKERNVYRPWQGGAYGGQIDFSHKGKDYRISRTFGRTEKTDEYHLYDLETNLECHDFSSEIGSEIFGLDSASFKRSVFIAQNDCACGSTDAINAKLGNLVENTSDINNFDTAQKRIHDRMNRLSPDRATGSIRKRTNAMTLIKEELRSYDAAETAAKEIGAKLAEKQEQRKELSDIRGQYARALTLASEETRREGLKNTWNTLNNAVLEQEKKIEAFDEVFPVRVPDEEELVQKNNEVKKLAELKTTGKNLELNDEETAHYSRLTALFENGVPNPDELAEMDHDLERLAKLKEEKAQLETKISYFEAIAMNREMPDYTVNRHKGLMILGVILIIIGIAGAAAAFAVQELLPYRMIISIAAGALILIGLIILIARNATVSRAEEKVKRRQLAQIEEEEKLRQPVIEIQKTMEEASEEAEQVEEKAMEFLGQYHIFCVSSDARSGLFELRSQIHEYDRLQSRKDKSKDVEEEYEALKESINDYARELNFDLGDDIAEGIRRMQMSAAEYRLAQEACAQAKKKRDDFSEENKIEELSEIDKCPYSLDELNSMIYGVDERIEDVREAIEQYNHQMDDLQEQLDMRDEKEQQLALCREEQKTESHTYEVLSLTRDFLQTAKEQFSARYLGPIENGFGKYYEFLTGDTSGDWMVDANITVKMKEQGQLRETRCLSAGYQDLLGICMRFALVDAMYQGEKPFLVLDDPFVNLDEDKMEKGTKLLKQISREYQILYFTCHESREMI